MHQVPRGPAKWMRMFAWCPLFPYTFASSAATCSNERAGHTGHPLFPSTGCRHSFFLPSSTPTLFISSLLGSDLHIRARWSTPFKFFETQSLLRAFTELSSMLPLGFIQYYMFTDTFDIFEWDTIPLNYTQSKWEQILSIHTNTCPVIHQQEYPAVLRWKSCGAGVPTQTSGTIMVGPAVVWR